MVILTELAPGSSSSSSNHHHNHRYDVFLSFRGADTRNTFTDHLYNALVDADITTFLDDEEIETGESLKPELESAIQSSRVSIIVLSKNYASSTWCLEELVLILEQNRKFNQIVFPIFYDVEPTDVRKQQRSFGEAMAKHKQRMEDETDAEKRSRLARRMELWKMALAEVADLKGKDSKGRKERELIEEVVTEIHRRLGVLLSHTPPLLIGMYYDIKFISSWLIDGSCHTADILMVVGMGGIGKTSLAKYVFRLHSSTFHKSSFIEGISVRCNERFNGLHALQKQLLGDIAMKTPLQVNDVSVYTSKIEKALARKKVFLVLDDIDSLDQLDALLGNKGLHPGSKIIITTKDASLIERCALFKSQAHPNHKEVLLNGLPNTESLELLCIHAFKSHEPKEGYEEISEKLVKYCEGHPLALEVLGKSLYKRDVAYWEECTKGLMKEPHFRIKNALRLSFDSLSSNDKDLFKHIACFFVGIDRDVTETILNACDLNSKSGIMHLIDKCFLRIGYDNMLMMHQLVQEIGRDLVCHESPDKPWKRSRLWCHEESFKVLKQKKGTTNLLGFALDMRMLEKEKLSGSLELKTDAFRKMDNLKLLQLNYVKMKGSYKNISKELRWLCMHGFHSKSIPSELPMKNLVVLDMSYSNIISFDMSYSSSQRFVSKLKGLIGSRSKDKRLLGSLKILDLSYCEQLHSLGGFFHIPALERLIVRNCISLIEVCESVEQCVELVHIDLSYCYKLKELPISIGKLKKVKTLLLDGCNSHESQNVMQDMSSPDISIKPQISSSAIMEAIPSDFKFFAFSFPSSLRVLSLANNNLSNESFPTDFSFLLMLEEFCLFHNPIVSMPNCVRSLPRLKELDMANCFKLVSIEHPPRTLRKLSVDYCQRGNKYVLRKIKFDPEMSPLDFDIIWIGFPQSSFEVDGIVKIQPMADVEERVLHSLGWKNLEFIKERRLRTCDEGGRTEISQTQMYYEFGIFSTIYEGGMPNWIRHRSMGPSISFTIPSSPKKLRGLNFCCTVKTDLYDCFALPMIKISNITKNHTWIYDPYIEIVVLSESFLSLLSHWMFGPNEMKAGYHITITLAQKYGSDEYSEPHTMECGIGFVYDENVNIEEEDEEDALGYYKSWNHIIGGDLRAFQVTTGEYILEDRMFTRTSDETNGRYLPFIDCETRYKEEEVSFKAFF